MVYSKMTLEQALQNLDNLLANSRLTRQEHAILQTSLQLLYEGAKKNEPKPETID